MSEHRFHKRAGDGALARVFLLEDLLLDHTCVGTVFLEQRENEEIHCEMHL
jgi:hypothetical protein